jgi:hypothetical protein
MRHAPSPLRIETVFQSAVYWLVEQTVAAVPVRE